MERLPNHIVEEILLRGGVGDMIRCTAVSKTWNALIMTNNFISKQRKNSLDQPLRDVLVRYCTDSCPKKFTRQYDEKYFLHKDDDRFDMITEFHLHLKATPCFIIVGSVHGVLCLYDNCNFGIGQICLWNPSIRKILTVRPVVIKLNISSGLIGFGHEGDDYKIVFTEIENTKGGANAEVHLFSVENGRWTVIRGHDMPNCTVHDFPDQIFSGGQCHWMAQTDDSEYRRTIILTFNLRYKKFGKIELPSSVLDADLKLGECQGKVALFQYSAEQDADNFFCSIWTMKPPQYWQKVLTVDWRSEHTALGMRLNGQFIFSTWFGDLRSFDPENKVLEDLLLCGRRLRKKFFLTHFPETLVLLDKGKSCPVGFKKENLSRLRFKAHSAMPKLKTNRVRYPGYPKGWELIEPTLAQLQEKMREAENCHDGKRKFEAQWTVLKIEHQKSRYIFDLYHRRMKISKKLYEFCLEQGYANQNLIAKWKMPGYEHLCCLRCMQSQDNNFEMSCVCRVPKGPREEKCIKCVNCGCEGCASGD